jgi:hypothetical protein
MSAKRNNGFWWESKKERDIDVGGWIILKRTLDRMGGMNWIDRDQ